MPAPHRAPLRLLRFLPGLLIAPLLLAADNLKPGIPVGNPYAPAYAALARLTSADKEALSAGKPVSASAAPIVADINRALAAGREASSVDWGVDYEHFNFSTSIPGLAESRDLAKIALAEAEKLPAPALVDRVLETMALARHVGQDASLINLLVQRGIEALADNSLKKHLSQLSPQDAGRLIAGIKALPPGGDLPTALAIEKMIFVDRPTAEIRQILEKLAEADAGADSFASRLRLTGLLTEGPITSVGLEQETDAFWLKPGENKHGITLLSVNQVRDEALLACDGRIARVTLSSKKITTFDFSRLAEAIKALPKDSLLREIMKEEGGVSGEASIRTLEQATREIGDLYAEAVAHPENFADTPAYKERVQKLSLLAQNAAEMLPRLIGNENKARERQAKLLAALSSIATPARP